MSFDNLVNTMAEKWREVPGGSDQHPRQFSDELLQEADAELLRSWSKEFEAARPLRGWYWQLYGELLRGQRVVEIGSGLGFDAMHLASQGAIMTCCDIVPSNLEVIQRVARHRGLKIETLHIDGLAAFDRLPQDFDAVWAIGSIHHMPFDEAREESHAILRRLKPGGRWIELTYPHERWVREGSPPFGVWGQVTDGDRTPWAEWYDVEKLKERLRPWRLETIMERRFESDAYVWMDSRVLGRRDDTPIKRRRVQAPPGLLSAPGPMWNYAWRTPLGPSPASAAVTVEIDCVVERGSVGFVMLHPSKDRFISREIIVEARTGNQRIHLATDAYEADARLLTRCATALGTCEYRISSIDVREAL